MAPLRNATGPSDEESAVAVDGDDSPAAKKPLRAESEDSPVRDLLGRSAVHLPHHARGRARYDPQAAAAPLRPQMFLIPGIAFLSLLAGSLLES